MFHGLLLLMENHLKRTLSRDQNPDAAASSSSFVGRCGRVGMCGRCRYLPDRGSEGVEVPCLFWLAIFEAMAGLVLFAVSLDTELLLRLAIPLLEDTNDTCALL